VNLRHEVSEDLTDALKDAFPNADNLGPLARALGKSPTDVYASADKLSARIAALVALAESQDEVFKLMAAACRENDANRKLKEFIRQYFHDPLTAGGGEGSPRPSPPPPPLGPRRCLLLIGALPLLCGVGVLAGYWWGFRPPGDPPEPKETELERVVKGMKVHDPDDRTLDLAWEPPHDLDNRIMTLRAKKNEKAFRIFQLGPWKTKQEAQTIKVLFGVHCKVWHHVFLQKQGKGQPSFSGEGKDQPNPTEIKLPQLDKGDSVFILVSFRQGAYPDNSEAEWKKIIRVWRE
jgi:hypothetical protein